MSEKEFAFSAEPGVREIRLTLGPDAKYESIQRAIEDVLTIPEIEDFFPRGCAPCLSGVDRIVITSSIFEQINAGRYG